MENNDIDKTFNEASKALDEPETFSGFDKVWNKIEKRLDKKKEKKKIISMWIPYGIAASLLVALGTFYFVSNSKTPTEIIPPIIAENTAGNKNTTIEKVDSTVKYNIQNQIKAPKLSKELKILAYHDVKVSEKPVINSPGKIEYSLENKIFKETSSPALPEKIDSTKRKNIEEVVILGLGLKKDKLATVSSAAVLSPNNIAKSKMKIEIDTAEALAYSDNDFDLKNEMKEPIALELTPQYFRNRNKVTTNHSLSNKAGKHSLESMLQRKTAGFSLNPTESLSSGKVDVIIHSPTNSKESPLYVINGKLTNLDEFRTLNPDRIIAITVLKDEKAIEFFGNKALGGAIIVDTKDISKAERKKLKEILIKARAKIK